MPASTGGGRPVGTSPLEGGRPPIRERAQWSDLAGFETDDHLDAYLAFLRTARALADGRPPLRSGKALSSALVELCRLGLSRPHVSPAEARAFFTGHFTPAIVRPEPSAGGDGGAFLTGYFEPIVDGARARGPGFSAPILARPDGLGRLPPGDAAVPYLSRAEIEAGAEDGRQQALVWLRDWVEVFFVQVQGSARVRLPDGSMLRLLYDGRNGHPYSSLGRNLLATGQITAGELSLEGLKGWLRRKGQAQGEEGRAAMAVNRSYVFFREASASEGDGPVGGAGVPLTALRSIAIDRTLWSYGLPFWIESELRWNGPSPAPFRRLMVAQDTGSAILGAARADIFFGSGEDAGNRAGDIRHKGRMVVLIPNGDASASAGAS